MDTLKIQVEKFDCFNVYFINEGHSFVYADFKDVDGFIDGLTDYIFNEENLLNYSKRVSKMPFTGDTKQFVKLYNNRITEEIIKQNGNSPLLQTRFIRQGIEKEFENEVRNILYKDAERKSRLLEEIGQLCVPIRGKIGIRAIINYNFDDLVEKNLEDLRLKYCSVYREGVMPDFDEIGIFHVHGFLPEKQEGFDNLAKSLLVFSEEGYHKLMLEPYNWANITQLNYLMSNTCVFVGLSMTDPNLRRLLDIAAQKDVDEKCKHYAIMKRFTIDKKDEDDEIVSFEQINEELQESFYRELGVNVIWIDDFSEVPEILSKIKVK